TLAQWHPVPVVRGRLRDPRVHRARLRRRQFQHSRRLAIRTHARREHAILRLIRGGLLCPARESRMNFPRQSPRMETSRMRIHRHFFPLSVSIALALPGCGRTSDTPAGFTQAFNDEKLEVTVESGLRAPGDAPLKPGQTLQGA